MNPTLSPLPLPPGEAFCTIWNQLCSSAYKPTCTWSFLSEPPTGDSCRHLAEVLRMQIYCQCFIRFDWLWPTIGRRGAAISGSGGGLSLSWALARGLGSVEVPTLLHFLFMNVHRQCPTCSTAFVWVLHSYYVYMAFYVCADTSIWVRTTRASAFVAFNGPKVAP